MRALDIVRPHGFLIWKGKQTSIVNGSPLLTNEKLGLLSDGELYGELILDKAQELTIDEIKEFDSHRLRDYEIKMMWSDVDKLYLHEIKNFEPYDEMIPAHVDDNGEIVLDDRIEPDESQKELLEIAESLPNQVLIDKNAVQLTDDLQVINGESIKELLTAAFGDVKKYEQKSDSILPLYQLALVRSPVLRFKNFAEPPNYRPLESSSACNNCLFFKKGHCELFGVDVFSNYLCDSYVPVIGHKQEGEDMPFEKIEREDEVCVINTETDEIQECYSGDNADEQADDLLTALRINVENEESKGLVLDIEEIRGQFNARFDKNNSYSYWVIDVLENNMLIVEHEGIRYQVKFTIDDESYIFDNQTLWLPVETVYEEKAGRRLKGSWLKKLKELQDVIKEMVRWADKEDELPLGFNGFGIKEDKENGDIFYAFSSNAFMDREGEIVSTKALEDYVRINEENEVKGYFNLFHVKNTDFAEVRFQKVIGRFLLESGPFLDNPTGRQVKKFLKKNPKSHPELAPEGYGASIEYVYLPEQRATGVYNWIFINRTSLLPKSLAANVNTTGALKMSDEKQLSPAQEHFVKNVLTEKLYDKLVTQAIRETEELEKTEEFKSTEDEVQEVPVETPDEDETEVDAESESTDEESVEEVETESVEEESVDEEPVETPDEEPVEVEQVIKSVVSELTAGLKSELEIIATFPEAIKELNERMDKFESNAVKQAETPRFSLLQHIKDESVKSDDSEGLTEKEVKEKAPQETESEKGFIASRINRS